jgi:SAM-dependent methyltransferase
MHNLEFDWLHKNFPKRRPELSPSYAALYINEYKRNRGSDNTMPSFKDRLEQWMHHQVANVTAPKGPILELGAGTLNHLSWEKVDCPYDIVEPFTELYEEKTQLSRLRHIYKSIFEIPPTAIYSKILSVAVLEHVTDLPCVVARCALLLSDDGVMVNGIPSEGGLLWYLAWKFGTGLSFRIRTGLPYTPLMRHEHVNTAKEILRILHIFFGDVKYTFFPLPFLHGSFYIFVRASRPNKRIAEQFLRSAQDEVV